MNPDWKDGEGEEDDILRGVIAANFLLSFDCRLAYDNILYRVSAEKKLQIHVQSVNNLTYKGHFAVFTVCVSNEMVSFNKESFVFMNFDMESDAYNPVFKDKPVVFGDVDLTDESSFNLIVLIEIKKIKETYSYHIYGMNVIPAVTEADIVLSGVFEVPMLDLELSGATFQELNNISAWQFQHRCLKEKKAKVKPASVIFRQNNSSLADMYPAKSCDFGISKVFMPTGERAEATESMTVNVKVADCVVRPFDKEKVEKDIKSFMKEKLYQGL